MTEDVCFDVFVAACSGTARAAAILGVPIAMVTIAMDVGTAIDALNAVGYGAGRPPRGGSDATWAEWTDWRLQRLAPPPWIMSRETPFPHAGTIRVPVDGVGIVDFAARFAHRLRPLCLKVPMRSASRRAICVGADLTALQPHHASRDPLRRSFHDIYAFDPASQGEWLFDMTSAALEEARRMFRSRPRRDPWEDGP